MANSGGWGLLRDIAKAVVQAISSQSARSGSASRTTGRRPTTGTPSSRAGRGDATGRAPNEPAGDGAYPGDYRGTPQISYAPHPGSLPDPGEIVWGWVPFEENHADGKDRPVLLIGRDDEWLLGLPLTSKDHDRDAAQEARAGRHWIDIGSGNWDEQRRPSEVRVDRIIRLAPDGVRRIAGKLDRDRFDQVAAEVGRFRR